MQSIDLNMKTESERQSALQYWNQKAGYYDNSRPDYPNELVKTIADRAGLVAGAKLLEIGAGSGKATVLFAKPGLEIVCVEPGADFVRLGEARFEGNEGIRYVASRFEDYMEPAEYFDAVISAQAFHWISQPLGYEKCARALKKGGYLAPFWHINLFRDDEALDRELWAIVNKYEGWVSCMPEKNYEERMQSITTKIAASGLFSRPEVIHFYQENTFTADTYLKYMLTGTDKTDEEKRACFDELSELADKYNGIKRRFTYELYLAQKL